MSRHESKHLSSDRVLDRKSPPRGTRHSPMGRCSSSEKKSPHKKDTTHRKKGPSLDKESELLVHGPICIDPAELKAIKVDIHRNISPAQQPPPPLQLDIGDPEQLTLYRKKGEGSRPLFANIPVNTGHVVENEELRRVWTDSSKRSVENVKYRNESPTCLDQNGRKYRRSRSLTPDHRVSKRANSRTEISKQCTKRSRTSPCSCADCRKSKRSQSPQRNISRHGTPPKRGRSPKRKSPVASTSRRISPRRLSLSRLESSVKHSSPSRKTSPHRGSPRRNSPHRGSPSRRNSPRRGSPSRRNSPRRGSPSRRNSPRRGSPSRKNSPHRSSPSRKNSPRRGSPSRKNSPRRGSPSRKNSPRRSSPSRKSTPRRGSRSRKSSPRRDSPRRSSPSRRSSPARRYSPGRRRSRSHGHYEKDRYYEKDDHRRDREERDRYRSHRDHERRLYRSSSDRARANSPSYRRSRSPHRDHVVVRRSLPVGPVPMAPGYETYYEMGVPPEALGVWLPRLPPAMYPRGFRPPPPRFGPRLGPFMQPMRFPPPGYIPHPRIPNSTHITRPRRD